MNIIKKYWAPIVIAVILIGFGGAVYYGKAIKPEKDIDKYLGYKTQDYITLGQYKGLKYEKSKPGFSEEDLKDAIEQELIDYKEVDRAIKKGDSVTINYVAYVDGKKDSNLSEKEFDIIIGDEDLAKEFDKALVGAKKGDKLKVKVSDVSSFPTENTVDYDNKKIEFEIKVKEVSEEFTAELTDEWVKENYGADYDCFTVEDFNKIMKDWLLEESVDEIEEQMKNDLWQMALDNAVMNSYPAELYDAAVAEDNADYAYWADYWGMNLEEYFEFLGYTNTEIEESYLASVKSSLVMWAIVKKEQITVTKDEIEQGYEDKYEDYDYDSAEAMKADYEDSEIKEAILLDKVWELIEKNAKIIEVESTSGAEE